MVLSELSSFQAGGLAIIVMLTGVWIFSVVKKDAGIIDAFWGLGFSIVALAGLLVSDNLELTLATGLLVIVWGVGCSPICCALVARKKKTRAIRPCAESAATVFGGAVFILCSFFKAC